MKKVGIVGIGGVASYAQIPAYIEKGIRIEAICDINEEILNKIGNKYNISNRYIDLEEMIVKELLPKLKKLLQRQRQLKKMLFGSPLKAEECTMICMRYLQGKNWNAISRELYKSKSSCYRCHHVAIKKLLHYIQKNNGMEKESG